MSHNPPVSTARGTPAAWEPHSTEPLHMRAHDHILEALFESHMFTEDLTEDIKHINTDLVRVLSSRNQENYITAWNFVHGLWQLLWPRLTQVRDTWAWTWRENPDLHPAWATLDWGFFQGNWLDNCLSMLFHLQLTLVNPLQEYTPLVLQTAFEEKSQVVELGVQALRHTIQQAHEQGNFAGLQELRNDILTCNEMLGSYLVELPHPWVRTMHNNRFGAVLLGTTISILETLRYLMQHRIPPSQTLLQING
eukprot:97804-Hanusia_phi.AAC.3